MMTMSKRRKHNETLQGGQDKSLLSVKSSNDKAILAKTKMLAANADELYDKFQDLATGYNVLSILTAIGMVTAEILRSIDDSEVRKYLCDIIIEIAREALDDDEETETL
jgi:hypothetical protein